MNLANKITILRVLLVPLFIVFFYLDFQYSQYIALAIFIIASITDSIDGHIARRRNLVTTFGKFVDPLADKILTTSAFILLVGTGKIPSWVVIIILAREFIISGLRVLAASNGVTIAASKWGKIKTITQLIAIILLLLNNFPFSYIGIQLDYIMLYISLFFTVLSGIDYVQKNIKILNLDDI